MVAGSTSRNRWALQNLVAILRWDGVKKKREDHHGFLHRIQIQDHLDTHRGKGQGVDLVKEKFQ